MSSGERAADGGPHVPAPARRTPAPPRPLQHSQPPTGCQDAHRHPPGTWSSQGTRAGRPAQRSCAANRSSPSLVCTADPIWPAPPLICIVICSVARPAAGDKEVTQHEITRASISAAKSILAWPIVTPGDTDRQAYRLDTADKGRQQGSIRPEPGQARPAGEAEDQASVSDLGTHGRARRDSNPSLLIRRQ
jgi:hypothetical protein